MGTMGNTFDVNTVKYGHARKVWREIRHRYPGGGMVSNISDWVAVGKIPAGTAVKFDLSGKTFTAYTDAQIKAAESDITTLGINGYPFNWLLKKNFFCSQWQHKGQWDSSLCRRDLSVHV